MFRELLLVSNTKVAGGEKFAHAREEIKRLFHDRKTITFIPYANPEGMGHTKYTEVMSPTFEKMGYRLQMIGDDPIKSIQHAEALYVGGGNTWKLLEIMKDKGLMYHVRSAVDSGTPYLGSSAGSGIAGLTIGNTNDMPSAESHGRDALGLVPFNVNPHYQDTVELSEQEREQVLKIAPKLKILIDHQGESRKDRIMEYHALGNQQKVVALREGAMIRAGSHVVTLIGTTGGIFFSPGIKPRELESGSSLSFLL